MNEIFIVLTSHTQSEQKCGKIPFWNNGGSKSFRRGGVDLLGGRGLLGVYISKILNVETKESGTLARGAPGTPPRSANVECTICKVPAGNFRERRTNRISVRNHPSDLISHTAEMVLIIKLFGIMFLFSKLYSCHVVADDKHKWLFWCSLCCTEEIHLFLSLCFVFLQVIVFVQFISCLVPFLFLSIICDTVHG